MPGASSNCAAPLVSEVLFAGCARGQEVEGVGWLLIGLSSYNIVTCVHYIYKERERERKPLI